MDDDAPDVLGPEDVKQVIVIRRDLKMRRARRSRRVRTPRPPWLANLVVEAFDPATRSATVTLDEAAAVWVTSSWRKVTVQAHSEEELVELHDTARARGLRSRLVQDSGRTEFGGVPTLTALAIGPDRAAVIDEVTGHLVVY